MEKIRARVALVVGIYSRINQTPQAMKPLRARSTTSGERGFAACGGCPKTDARFALGRGE
eukprot:3926589-Rhodomonas_salina.1